MILSVLLATQSIAPPPPPAPPTQEQIAQASASWAATKVVTDHIRLVAGGSQAELASFYERSGALPVEMDGEVRPLRSFYQAELVKAGHTTTIQYCMAVRPAYREVRCRMFVTPEGGIKDSGSPTYFLVYAIKDGALSGLKVIRPGFEGAPL